MRRLSAAQVRAHLADPLYRTSYLLVLSTATTALLGFGFWTIGAHEYSPRNLGLNAAAISAMTFVAGFAQLGLGALLIRYLPAAGMSARRLVLNAYATVIAVALVLGATAALTSSLWSPSLGFIGHSALWSLGFTGGTVAWCIFSLQDNVLAGLGAAHVLPVENTGYAVVKLAALVVLAGIAPLAGPFIAWNAPTVVGVALISWLIFSRLVGRAVGRDAAPEATLPSRRTLVANAGTTFIGSTLLQVSVMVTPLVVADIAGPRREAFFFAPWTVLVALNALTVSTMTSLIVQGARDPAQVYVLARRSLVLTLALLTPLVLCLIIAAPLILRIYGTDYAHAGTGLMRLLALSLFPSAVSSIALGVARVRQLKWTLLAIQALPSLLQLGLTVWLLHVMGIRGAGLAQLASDGAAAVILLATLMRPVWHRKSRVDLKAGIVGPRT